VKGNQILILTVTVCRTLLFKIVPLSKNTFLDDGGLTGEMIPQPNHTAKEDNKSAHSSDGKQS